MKILLADDHAVVRGGLRQLLAAEVPKARFGEAGTCEEAMARLAEGAWDALLLDIFMPGRSGLEVLREVRSHWPNLPVLVLSSAPEDQLAVRVLQAGASGYLNKQAAPEELVMAVRKILGGGRYVSATLAEKLAAQAVRPRKAAHERLSEREFEVMQQLVSGKSVKEIAAGLGLSPKTISTFHTRILAKLQIQNDAELVRYALEHRLLESALPPERPGEASPLART